MLHPNIADNLKKLVEKRDDGTTLLSELVKGGPGSVPHAGGGRSSAGDMNSRANTAQYASGKQAAESHNKLADEHQGRADALNARASSGKLSSATEDNLRVAAGRHEAAANAHNDAAEAHLSGNKEASNLSSGASQRSYSAATFEGKNADVRAVPSYK